jgi:hypothetical protein
MFTAWKELGDPFFYFRCEKLLCPGQFTKFDCKVLRYCSGIHFYPRHVQAIKAEHAYHILPEGCPCCFTKFFLFQIQVLECWII